MVTIFAIPKPFHNHVGIIQRNAIKSWSLLRPACEIILFGDAGGIKEAADEFGVRYDDNIMKNEYGTPYINSVFYRAEQLAKYDLLCYVNCDIILTNDLLKAVSEAANSFKKHFLLLGRRWNIEIDKPLDFSFGWESRLRGLVDQSGWLEAPTGIDYFVFKKGLWGNIPPFAVGRTAWDNWLIYKAREQNIPVIDATSVVRAVHQVHQYFHCQDGKKGVWEGPEAQANLELAKGFSHLFILYDSTHIFTSTGIKLALSMKHLKRRFYMSIALFYDSLKAAWLKYILLKLWRIFKK